MNAAMNHATRVFDMLNIDLRRGRWLIGLALFVAAGTALAATAGKVLFVAGDVHVERAAATPLAAGDAIEVGDVVVTGAKSRAQLLMADGAKIALRSGSRFRIDALTLPAAVNAPGQATATAKDGSSIATLLKGGFRTSTGSIGKTDPNAYEVRTPVGVLGIRGTDYTAVFCAGDCNDAPGVAPGEAIRDGLYLGVTTGRIAFRITGGPEILVDAGNFVFIPLRTPAPEQLPTEPAFLREDGAGQLQVGRLSGPAPEGGQGISELGERRGPPPPTEPGTQGLQTEPSLQQPIQGTDPQGRPIDLTSGNPPPGAQRRDVGFAIASLGQAPIFTDVSEDAPSAYVLDANADLVGFGARFPAAAFGAVANYQIGTATIAESGGDAATELRWGRWSGGVAQATVAGNTQPVDLLTRSLHWVVSPDADIPPAIPQNGIVSYTLLGATSPTDGSGATGTLGSAQLDADFTNATITSRLDLTIGSTQWSATGAGAIGAQAGVAAHQFGGAYNVVITGGQVPGGTGTFSGFFSTQGGTQPGVPGGVGLSYSLIDDAGLQSVQGAAAFEAP